MHTRTALLRWLVFLSTIVNITFNYVADMTYSNSISTVSKKYESLFVPSGYAFSIWLVIYLAQIIYAIFQLLPANRQEALYDRLAWPLVISYAAGIGWGAAYRSENFPMGMAFIFTMLLTAIILMLRAHKITDKGFSRWLLVPFSLYAGWLAVANIAQLTEWMVAVGKAPGETGTIILILVAALAALAVQASLKDWLYPLVFVWSATAIWVARRDTHPGLAMTALIAAVIVLAWTVIAGLRNRPASSEPTPV
jgi:hypothetical protein